jgi:xylulokinase
MSVILSAAANLDWVTALCGFKDIPEAFTAAETRGLTQQSPIFLPYLSGERTPHNDPLARGMFFGLSANTDKADLAYAVLEGVALAFADGLDVLTEAGSKIGNISVTGGGARIPYWGRLLASALDKPLTYREGGEIGAAFGAARLGRLAVTGEKPEAVCIAPKAVCTVEPQAELKARLAHRRLIYVSLYQNLKKAFREFAI